MTWRSEISTVNTGRTRRHLIHQNDAVLSYAEALRLLETDDAFITFLNDLLANAPFSAFRWETPPVTAATLDRSFEFVLLDDPRLSRPADATAFSSQLAAAGDAPVTGFANLGKDAWLIVPRPIGPRAAYGHLAAFVRLAPPGQRGALWRAVAQAMHKRVGDPPVWLSTAGAGVPWLHVRLDDHPKYYGYHPYRAAH